MADESLKTTLVVAPDATNGLKDTFEFTIPSLHQEIGIGARMAKIHRAIDPDWNGFSQDLDQSTNYSLRAAATFEMLLLKSSATWPFFKDATGKVIVDSSKFPLDKAVEALQAFSAFDDALARFRAGGDSNIVAIVEKVVDGESSPKQPISV